MQQARYVSLLLGPQEYLTSFSLTDKWLVICVYDTDHKHQKINCCNLVSNHITEFLKDFTPTHTYIETHTYLCSK